MELIDPWRGTTQAAQTLAALGQQIQTEKKNDQSSQLADLQMKQLQSANAEKEATDTALIDTYGTADRGDRTAQLAAAKSFQSQKTMMDSDLKADQATVKEIFDLAAKVKEKGLGPDAVTPLIQGYASQLKSPQLRQLYGNLKLTDGWGAKTTVMLNGNEGYTHPITGQPLPPGEYEMEFDQNHKPTKVNLVKAADVEFFKNADGLPIATGNKHTGTVKTLADVVPPNQYGDASGSSGFQSAIGGLLDQSKAGSLYQLGNTGVKTGYAPFGEVEKDIRMAGSDYGAKPDAIDKAVDNARGTYKETYIQGKPQKSGRTTFTPEYNLLGQQKDVAKGTEIVVKTGSDKAPSGYRFTADGKSLEPIAGGPADPNNSSKHGGNKQLSGPILEGLSDQAQILKTLREAQTIAGKIDTGPVSGRLQSAGQLVGASGKEFNNFKQKLATANNIMLKARSGAAVTDQEYARFKQEMPTVNDDESVRDQKLANAIGYMDELLKSKLTTFQEGGYRIPEGLMARSQLGSTAPPRKAAPAQPQKPKTASDYLSKFK